MKINRENGTWAIYGGALFGGGGGGDLQEGLRTLDMALSYMPELPFYSLSELNDQAILLTASLVGSPASAERYIAPAHYKRVYEIFCKHFHESIKGIITNELGGQSSTNGWVLAAMTGLPLIDAPCNGRAHPTGMMGSLGLANETDYRSLQAAVGGKNMRETELFVRGELRCASSLVRSAASAAGGFVTVLRNPVSAGYVAKNAAIGALSRSMEAGRIICQKLGKADDLADALQTNFGFETLCRGKISDCTLHTSGGFDQGTLLIENEGQPVELTFWNEYMTAERAGRRIATFPDLIAILDDTSGLPLTSSTVRRSQHVILVKLGYEHLLLGSSMHNRALFEDVEKTLNKELIKYVF